MFLMKGTMIECIYKTMIECIYKGMIIIFMLKIRLQRLALLSNIFDFSFPRCPTEKDVSKNVGLVCQITPHYNTFSHIPSHYSLHLKKKKNI
jgi:hypothetical protein